jgi:hypothetical protein
MKSKRLSLADFKLKEVNSKKETDVSKFMGLAEFEPTAEKWWTAGDGSGTGIAHWDFAQD